MIKVLALCLVLFIASANGLKCYVCIMTDSETDECVTDPASATAIAVEAQCSLKYCTIVRQEYKDPAGKLSAFYRRCEQYPVHLNDMIDDGTFRTYYRACSSDLCNVGDGIRKVTNGTDGSGVITLLVPGIGTDGTAAVLPSFLTISLLLAVALRFAFPH